MIFRRFPYTTLNDINLDWIIKQVKQIAAALQGKQDKPETAGVAGQVLGLDDNLDPVWLDQSGGGGGTTNYNSLTNKPQINGVTLSGNKTTADLGISIPTGSLALPLMDGTASAGTNLSRFALEGHVHPTDTSRASNSVIGIVQNTNTATQNISAGQYVIWNGALYIASAAIATGATLSNSNLTAVTGGGLNDVGRKLSAFQNVAVTTVLVRWNTDLSDQTVSVVNGLYLVTVDSRNTASDGETGLYIVESNDTYNSHVTTVHQPTTPKASISINAGALTVSPQTPYGIVSIVKMTN